MKIKPCASSVSSFRKWVEGGTTETALRKPSTFIVNVVSSFLTYLFEERAL